MGITSGFFRALKEQRWDDHRYYHHSRINQSLHLVSAMSFVCSYYLLFTRPVAAALIGWIVAMVTRQSGHFFFEPKGYDTLNQATHQYKEDVKVGYNLRRKVVLMAVWGLSPLVLYLSPTLLGVFKAPWVDGATYLEHLSKAWIAIGVGAILFRMVQLFFQRDVQTGLVWVTKILTDPFHDILLYHKAPLYLLKGQLVDPMSAEQHGQAA